MTKREICERLLILYADVNSLQTQIGVWTEPLDDAERALRKAILDLAAPKTEEEKEAAFKERCRAVFGDLAAPDDHIAGVGKKVREEEG